MEPSPRPELHCSAFATAGLPPITKFLGNIAKNSVSDPSFLEHWNQVTPENSGKWGRVEAVRDRMDWTALDAAYRLAKTHRLPFKFHTFIWGQDQPAWIGELSQSEQREEIEEWIHSVCARYPDLDLIDVVNEPLHTPPAYREAMGGAGATGHDWVIWAFDQARRHAPKALLLLNEYDVEKNSADMEAYIALAKILKDRRLLDGIGLQGHFLETTPLDTIKLNVERLAHLEVSLYISELDLSFASDSEQLAKFQEHFPYYWEHTLIKGITLWGYKEGGMWRKDGHLVRADGTERPALTWLRDYVREATAQKPFTMARP